MRRLLLLFFFAITSQATAQQYMYSLIGMKEVMFSSAYDVCANHNNNVMRYPYMKLGPEGETTFCYLSVEPNYEWFATLTIIRWEKSPPPEKPPVLQTPSSPTCVSNAIGTATLFAGWVDKDGASVGNYKLPTSFGGCNMQTSNVNDCWSYQSDVDAGGQRKTYCTFTFKYTGEKSSSNASNDNEGAPANLENNGCPEGSHNIAITKTGVVCAPDKPQGTSKETTSSSTVMNPDGSTDTTTTNKKTVGNSDGTSTVTTSSTTVTKHPDGTISTGPTTTTVTTSAGNPKGDGTERDDFCQEYPNMSICKESKFTSTCQALSCEGDAIQCAIARRQHEDSCQAKNDRLLMEKATYTTLGHNMLDGRDPLAEKLPTPQNGHTISVGALNADGFLGDGRCLANKVITVYGKNIVIPLSEACPYLIVLRYVIMSIAALASLKIIAGAIRS